jgi:GT2 family glycosyltransferase
MSEAAGQPRPRVGTVVLNWHGRPDTVACLRALALLSYPNLFAIVLDNGCSEFSAEEVAGLFPAARYLRTDVNLGFAGGANLGMREALGAGADYVWFLNSDARPEPAALTELVAVAEAAPPAIVGAKILQLEQPQRLDSIALDIDLRTGRLCLKGHDEIDTKQYDRLRDVSAVTACAMLVSRAACERLQGFDEQFFAYLEDADLCLRAHTAGVHVMVAPRARVLHNRVAATGPRQSTASLYLTTRNHLLLMHRHGTGGPFLRALRPLAVALLSIAYALRGAGQQRRARLHAVLRGLRDYRRGVVGEGAAFQKG